MTKREIILAAAQLWELKSAEAHADGMAYLRRAVRLEQLAKILTDEGVEKLCDELDKEGMLFVMDPDTKDDETSN